MTRTSPVVMQNIDTAVAGLIAEARQLEPLAALRLFLASETHALVLDDATKLWHFSPLAIFDMWENEVATGSPQNSLYLRGDEVG